jgi:hypothetical protein
VHGNHCGWGASSTRIINVADKARTISPDSASIQGSSGHTNGHSGRIDLPDLWQELVLRRGVVEMEMG